MGYPLAPGNTVVGAVTRLPDRIVEVALIADITAGVRLTGPPYPIASISSRELVRGSEEDPRRLLRVGDRIAAEVLAIDGDTAVLTLCKPELGVLCDGTDGTGLLPASFTLATDGVQLYIRKVARPGGIVEAEVPAPDAAVGVSE